MTLAPTPEMFDFGRLSSLSLLTLALPSTLEALNLGRRIDHPVGRGDRDAPLLPDGLEELRLGGSLNRSIENISPAGWSEAPHHDIWSPVRSRPGLGHTASSLGGARAGV